MGICSGGARIMAGLVTAMLLTGCAGAHWGADEREQLLLASDGYNALLRWKELDKACSAFAEDSVRGGCLGRAGELKDLQITDIRRRDLNFKVFGDVATVNIEIEYYLLPSMVVRKIQESQRWVYLGTQDKRVWRITNPISIVGLHL